MDNRYLFKAKTNNGKWIEWNILTGIPHDINIINSTICQCTGLKDKNGKLIWENDIVCHAYTKYQKENTDYPPFCRVEKRKNYVIKWDNTMVHLGFRYHNGRNIFPFKNGTVINGDDEVIGNVFDNPELLESEEAGR